LSNAGQTLVKRWSNAGQTLVKRHYFFLFFKMTRCQCCDGECAYCNAMGYTWPKVKRMKGSSDSALCRHMLLHPCCKKPKTGIVIHPSTMRPLIFEALPYDIQGELVILYGDNLPMIHPFPRPLESIFEVQVHLQVVLTNDRMTILLNRTTDKRMKCLITLIITTMEQRYIHLHCQWYHYKYINLTLESKCEY
jgi:hypothetical protein